MSEVTAYILYAHGARDPEWAMPIQAIKAQLTVLRPEVLIETAFLEHMAPTLDTAVGNVAARGARRVVVVPLFFGRGGHLKKDFPRALDTARAAHPELHISASAAMGEDAGMIAAIAQWIAQTSGSEH